MPNISALSVVLGILYVLTLPLIALTVYAVIRRRANRDTAEEILKRRYALGEIDESEFRRRLHEIS